MKHTKITHKDFGLEEYEGLNEIASEFYYYDETAVFTREQLQAIEKDLYVYGNCFISTEGSIINPLNAKNKM